MFERIKIIDMKIELMIKKIKLTLMKCKKRRLCIKMIYKCTDLFGKDSILYLNNQISSEEYYNDIKKMCETIEHVRES